jgi:hypothetical protein
MYTEIILKTYQGTLDCSKSIKKLQKEIESRTSMTIVCEPEYDPTSSIYTLFINYGNDSDFIGLSTNMDDLEIFANSILKSIEMTRRDYSMLIESRRKIGNIL